MLYPLTWKGHIHFKTLMVWNSTSDFANWHIVIINVWGVIYLPMYFYLGRINCVNIVNFLILLVFHLPDNFFCTRLGILIFIYFLWHNSQNFKGISFVRVITNIPNQTYFFIYKIFMLFFLWLDSNNFYVDYRLKRKISI